MVRLSLNFFRKEFECPCGCGFDTVDAELIKVLQDLRDAFGKGVRINSGCRCNEYNKQIGGSKKSQHVLGRAADIAVNDTPPSAVYEYLNSKYPNLYGLGKYSSFVHIDTRKSKARWKG